jgi:hypothetical protein
VICEGTGMMVAFETAIEFGPGISMVGGPVCQLCCQSVVPEDGQLLAPEHEYVKYDGPPKRVWLNKMTEGIPFEQDVRVIALSE